MSSRDSLQSPLLKVIEQSEIHYLPTHSSCSVIIYSVTILHPFEHLPLRMSAFVHYMLATTLQTISDLYVNHNSVDYLLHASSLPLSPISCPSCLFCEFYTFTCSLSRHQALELLGCRWRLCIYFIKVLCPVRATQHDLTVGWRSERWERRRWEGYEYTI